MTTIDRSIPSAVFTRTDSSSKLPELPAPQCSGASRKPPPSGSTEDNMQTIMEEGGRAKAQSIADKKMDEILSCLEGTLEPSVKGHRYEVEDEDRVVDLWHLRHLALSRGGLMSPSLRKRAWPKLVGVDEHILTTTSASIPSLISSGTSVSGASVASESNEQDEPESIVELTNKDIKVVKQDIGRCVWHVEYHIKMLRKQREKSKGGNGKKSKDANNNVPSALSNFSTSTQSDYSMESPDIGKPQHRSKREMGLILNIITAVLRSVPEGEEMSRLHYFQGLHDVAALFLINLESPSLTSLVMKRLCHLHFRDAMRPTFQKVQIILQAIIMPLLEIVDRKLHDYIIQGGTDDSSVFALSWILTWFAHDVHNFDVVSRLFDVFLVSHPLFPAYLCVAMLTHPLNRSAIMSTNCEFSALYETICELPKKMASHEESKVMNLFEDLIQTALIYIRDSPPSKLILLARVYRSGYMKEYLVTAPSVFLLEDPPRWAIAPTAPTDWSLIKLAQLMRTQSPEARLARRRCLRLRHFVEKIDLTSDEHDIALVAFGLRTSSSTRRRLRLIRTNRLVGIVLLVGTLYGNEYYRGPTPLARVLPISLSRIGQSYEMISQRLSKPRSKSKPRTKSKPRSKPKPKPKPVLLTNEKVSNVASPQEKYRKDPNEVTPSENLPKNKPDNVLSRIGQSFGIISQKLLKAESKPKPKPKLKPVLLTNEKVSNEAPTFTEETRVGSILKEMQADLNQLEAQVDKMKEEDDQVEYVPISKSQDPINIKNAPSDRPIEVPRMEESKKVPIRPPSEQMAENDDGISPPYLGTDIKPALVETGLEMENDDNEEADVTRTEENEKVPLPSDQIAESDDGISSNLGADIEPALVTVPEMENDDDEEGDQIPVSTSQEAIDIKLVSTNMKESEKDPRISAAIPPSDQVTESNKAIISPPVATDGEVAPVENELELVHEMKEKDGGDSAVKFELSSQEPSDFGPTTDEEGYNKVYATVSALSSLEEKLARLTRDVEGFNELSVPPSINPTIEVNQNAIPSPKIDAESSLIKTDPDLDEKKDTTTIFPDAEDEIITGIKDGLRKIINQAQEYGNIIEEPVDNLPQVQEGSSADLVLKLFQKEIEKTAEEILMTAKSDGIMNSIFPHTDPDLEKKQLGELISKVMDIDDKISNLIPPRNHPPIPTHHPPIPTHHPPITTHHPTIPIQDDGDTFSTALQVRIEDKKFKEGNMNVIDAIICLVKTIKTFFWDLLLNENLVFF